MAYTASVYQKPDRFLIQADKETVDGWRLADTERPVLFFPRTVTAQEIGSALINLMQTSRVGGTRPSDWKTLEIAYLKALGMKSIRELHKECKLCSVSLEEGEFTFYSTKNLKTGFNNIAGTAISVKEINADKVGTALFEALNASQ